MRALLFIPLCALLSAATTAAGQTILNVERFQMAEVDGFHAGVTLSGSASFGNTEVVNVRGEGIVGHLEGRHWPRVIFGGSYLRARGREAILDNQFLQLRYSYRLSSTLNTFHFIQVQRNQTLLLRERTLFGSGLRSVVARSERTTFDLGVGAMLETERLEPEALAPGDDAHARTVRFSTLGVLTHQLPSGARIVAVTYHQPRVTALGDVRLLGELSLRAPVTSALGLTLSGNWRHDSRPPAALRRDDVGIAVGLSLDVR